MTRTVLSLAVAVLTALLFAVLPRAGRLAVEQPAGAVDPPETAAPAEWPAAAPPRTSTSRTFLAVRREAVALAEKGRLADAIAVGTEALRIGEKSCGKDRVVTREELDRLANAIERWYVELD